MRSRGVTNLNEAIVLGNVFNLMATENDDGQIEINAFNSGGHTNLILTAEDKFYIREELRDRRLNEQLSRQAIHPDYMNQHSVEQNSDAQRNVNTDYSFLWKCFSTVASITGAALLIVGIIYSFPVIFGLGVGVGFIGGCGLLFQFTRHGFFSNPSHHDHRSLDESDELINSISI